MVVRVRKQLRWIIPLLVAPLIYLAALLAAGALSNLELADPSAALAASLGTLALLALAVIGPIVAIVIAIVGAVRVARESKARRLAAAPADDQTQAAWAHARSLRSRLIARDVPDQIRVWDVVPNPGEMFFLDVPADYARFYGQDVTYTQSSGFFYGRPAFVLAGLGIAAASNAARRSAAQAQAVAQWRENQPCRLLVSNQRLVCNIGGQWLSFYYSAITAVYPEVESYTLIAQFESAAPLMLHGRAIPAAAVITTLMTHGADALVEHPSLSRLGESPDDPAASIG